MMKSRLLLHPVLSNRRSRSILLLYLVTVLGSSAFIWWQIFGELKVAGLNIHFFSSENTVPLLSFLLSPYIQLSVVFFSVLIAAATTAMAIVGPVRRIEQWLLDWDLGYSLPPLEARTGDTYDNLIRLINDLHLVKKPHRANHSHREEKQLSETRPS